MIKQNYGFELITLGNLLRRERSRKNEKIKSEVLGPNNTILCTDLNILGYLVENEYREVRQKDIELFLALTAPSVSNKLKELEKKGLISKSCSLRDTRVKVILVTDKGKNINALINEDDHSFENDISRLLNEDEKKMLDSIYLKLSKRYV